MDPRTLLDQILGEDAGARLRRSAQGVSHRLDQAGGTKAFASGAAAGGLLGLLLGSKKARKLAGGALGYGGAAVLGALAQRAYQNYRAGQDPSVPRSSPAPARLPAQALPHSAPAADGTAFELVLVQAMIAAAKADGHLDEEEQRRLFAEVERMGFNGEAKAFVFDALSQPIDLAQLAAAVAGDEQAAELYLASRLAIDPDHPAERAYLDALASRLGLPAQLRAHLDAQVAG